MNRDVRFTPARRGPVWFVAFLVLAGLGVPVGLWLKDHGLLSIQAGLAGETSSGVSAAPEGVEVTLVSWNIEWFPGKRLGASEEEAARHMAQVRGALPLIEADVFLLQEMRDYDSVEALFAGTDDQEVHIVSRFRQGFAIGRQQLGIVSRFSAKAAFTEVFVSGDGPRAPPRGFAFAALDLPDGRILLVYSVHLKANIGDTAMNILLREMSAGQIVSHVEDMMKLYPDAVVVVGGDFNLLLEQEALAHERTVAIFEEAGFRWNWEGVPFERRVTWPARGRYGDACFDHFFVLGAEIVSTRILPEFDALSDHRPVEIVLSTGGSYPRVVLR